jgi:hypothetical protein
MLNPSEAAGKVSARGTMVVDEVVDDTDVDDPVREEGVVVDGTSL